MSSLPHAKGVRTRFRNTLQDEMKRGNDIIVSDVDYCDIDELLVDSGKSIKIMKLYIDKLEMQSEKVAVLMVEVDPNDPKPLEVIADEDAKLCSDASRSVMELESFVEKLISVKKNSDKSTFKSSASETERLIVVQEQMKEMMNVQTHHQREFIEYIKEKERMKENESYVKLPKLDSKMFFGNKIQWCEFWDTFECTIHRNERLSDIEKFSYLQSKLGGEAKRAIDGLARSGGNYKVAVKLLQERFGNKQDIVNIHYKEMMNIQPPSYKVEGLRTFMDAIERHLRSLEVLGENVNQHVFVSMITSKLPESILRQLEINKGAEVDWDVALLRTYLRNYICACEKSDKSKTEDSKRGFGGANKTGKPFSKGYGNFRNGAVGSSYRNSAYNGAQDGALLTNDNRKVGKNSNPIKCRYCDKPHWSDECDVYRTVEERKRRIRGSCYKCLMEGHISSDCKSSRTCVHCGETNVHHRSLCGKRFKTAKTKESVQLCGEVARESIHMDKKADGAGLLSLDESVIMQTASVEVKSVAKEKVEMIRLLLDSGSHRTYVTLDLARKLGLKIESEQEIRMVTFGSKNTHIVKTQTTTLQMNLKNGSYISLVANIVPTITGNIYRKSNEFVSSEEFSNLTKHLSLADTVPKKAETIKLDMLVGNDYYLDLIQSEKIELKPGLYLLSSRLGWILSGRVQSEDISRPYSRDVNMVMLTYEHDSAESSVFSHVDDAISRKPNLTDFWNIEALGIIDKAGDLQDDYALRNFKETVKRVNGRYEVTWPWRDEFPELPENRALAIGRLKSLGGRLQRQPTLLKRYNEVIQEQLEKGIIEKVDRSQSERLKHYIPHHVVIKPDNNTTKLRIVYDASAKTKKSNKSLNECLYRGPVLLRNLCGILMRFRFHEIGIVSDIEKAFLQVGLQTSERDVTRFLWFKDCLNTDVKDENIQEYRFCRVPFGVISSPFLLGASIEHHLDGYESQLADKLKKDIYMDNLITGSNSVEGAKSLYENAKDMFSDAKMNLREWLTSSSDVNKEIPLSDRGSDTTIKVLGHVWDTINDTLGIQKPKVLDKHVVLTKRNVLSQVASVFDPLGLISPVTMRGKALMQKIWNQKLDWDDKISEETSVEWLEIKKDLDSLESLKLKRSITSGDTDKEYSLVCFADASKTAYAAAVYLVQRTKDEMNCDLIFAKCRLAPMKQLTIPKLELMAVLIGVRILKFVQDEIYLPIRNVFIMTDSLCTLQWIHSEKSLPVFIRNRVKEIRDHKNLQFRHVNTKLNPADIVSRGCDVKTLAESEMWWHGPDCLPEIMDDEKSIGKIKLIVTEPTESKVCLTEVDKNQNESTELNGNRCTEGNQDSPWKETVLNVDENKVNDSPFGITVEKYSSLTKLVRVTAWCLKFISKLKGNRDQQKSLSRSELELAETMLINSCQRRNFKDELDSIRNKRPNNLSRQLGIFEDKDGLLRCMGRLQHAELSEGTKHPILLPKKDRLTYLLVDKIHKKNFHSGVSQTLNEIRLKYWIPQGRAVVRSILKQCIICRRYEGGPYKIPDMAPLPKSRVTASTPFERVGIDYMGPLHVKDNSSTRKVWICLFTCLVTRAVHLELVNDMSSQSFIMCLRRFISRRGTPSEIISDNAKHFKLTNETIKKIWNETIRNNDVQDYVLNEKIKWIFNVELAPWMGGFYERLVGIVKRALRKVIGKKVLTVDQMQTVVYEVEAVVNRRPLVYVSDDLNSTIIITPAHFLCLNPNIGIPETDDEDEHDPEYKQIESSADKLLRIWKKGEKLLNQFWKIWQGDYLLSLRERMQTKIKTNRIQSDISPKTGDVVLIKDDLPRGQWKLGKVINLRVSKDCKVRSAEVINASGKIFNRPLKFLYPVEASSEHSENEVIQSENSVKLVDSKQERQKRSAAIVAKKLFKSMI